MIKMVIGGDVCPTGRAQGAFASGNAEEIFHDLLDEISGADLSVVNLECPLVTRPSPIVKDGPVLGARPECVRGFAVAKWNVVNLANNHSFDHGAEGLRESIQTIRQAGLEVVGAGMNVSEAKAPFITRIGGQRIVIYSMAEREFSIADDDTAGANPMDLINLIAAIHLHKQDSLFVVLIHGGNEHYPYPSPEMVRRCRFIVEMGADAVVCCHTHCALPWEMYRGRPIVYGLGNLVMETNEPAPHGWCQGYLAELTISAGRVDRFEAIPYTQSDGQVGAQKMKQGAASEFFAEMQVKSQQIEDDALLRDLWVSFCRTQRADYLGRILGYGRLPRRVRALLARALHSDTDVLRALHYVQCEAHREVLETIFDEKRRGK